MHADGGRLPTKHNGFEKSVVFKDRSRSARLLRYAANAATIILLGFCAYHYTRTNILRPIPGLRGPSDFAVYYQAARDVVSGTSPYENAAYFYPPLVAFLMTPFALTDYVSARTIWFVLSHLM